MSRVRVASWREAYADLLPSEFLAAMDPDEQSDYWRAAADRLADFWVAERDGDVVGFAVAGRPRDEHPPRHLELGLLYLLRTEYGSGAGQALLEAALGDRPASLWVAEGNPRAVAFYRRNGFEPDGSRQVEEQWGGMVSIRMVR